jgi:hypothetical protein
MRILLIVTTVLLLLSCSTGGNRHSEDSLLNTFHELSSKSNRITISFGKDFGFDTVITELKTVKWLRETIQESVKADTCYHLTGRITFYSDTQDNGSIDFGLKSICPSFYFYLQGKPVTYRMSYRSGMYLSGLQNKVLKRNGL